MNRRQLSDRSGERVGASRAILKCLAVLAVASPAGTAAAVDFQDFYRETTGDFSLTIIHPAITRDDSHVFRRGTLWENRNVLGEVTRPFGSDGLAFSLTAKHITAPHDEPANVNVGVMADSFDASDYPTARFVLSTYDPLTVGHGEHYNKFFGKSLIRFGHLFGIDDISGYALVFVGIHTDDPASEYSIFIDTDMRSKDFDPPQDPNPVLGTLLMDLDTRSGRANMTILADGLPRDRLLGAAIHVAPPGMDGPAVYDLGAPGLWEDFTTHSLRYIHNAPLAQELIEQILAGNAYVSVRSVEFPNGHLRGQLAVAAEPAGDFDGDNDVDAADLVQWQSDFALNGDSDADGDGDSDGVDFLLWQRHLGVNDSPSAAAAVPEPLAFTVAASSLLAVSAARRRHCRAT
jgi:hypothetical protein